MPAAETCVQCDCGQYGGEGPFCTRCGHARASHASAAKVPSPHGRRYLLLAGVVVLLGLGALLLVLVLAGGERGSSGPRLEADLRRLATLDPKSGGAIILDLAVHAGPAKGFESAAGGIVIVRDGTRVRIPQERIRVRGKDITIRDGRIRIRPGRKGRILLDVTPEAPVTPRNGSGEGDEDLGTVIGIGDEPIDLGELEVIEVPDAFVIDDLVGGEAAVEGKEADVYVHVDPTNGLIAAELWEHQLRPQSRPQTLTLFDAEVRAIDWGDTWGGPVASSSGRFVRTAAGGTGPDEVDVDVRLFDIGWCRGLRMYRGLSIVSRGRGAEVLHENHRLCDGTALAGSEAWRAVWRDLAGDQDPQEAEDDFRGITGSPRASCVEYVEEERPSYLCHVDGISAVDVFDVTTAIVEYETQAPRTISRTISWRRESCYAGANFGNRSRCPVDAAGFGPPTVDYRRVRQVAEGSTWASPPAAKADEAGADARLVRNTTSCTIWEAMEAMKRTSAPATQQLRSAIESGQDRSDLDEWLATHHLVCLPAADDAPQRMVLGVNEEVDRGVFGWGVFVSRDDVWTWVGGPEPVDGSVAGGGPVAERLSLAPFRDGEAFSFTETLPVRRPGDDHMSGVTGGWLVRRYELADGPPRIASSRLVPPGAPLHPWVQPRGSLH